MGRKSLIISTTPEQMAALVQILRAPTSEQRIARRARIVMLRAEGISQGEVARMVGVGRSVVAAWERRFALQGIEGLQDAAGRGRPSSLPEAKVAKVVEFASQPPPNRRRWSVRTMARQVGLSPASVQRIWAANDLKPHLTKTFKFSNDPQFEAKFWDVIGLYLDPPCKALVLCCDEKSQCQALERTQPGLPLGVGHIRTKTHDYYRHGTVTLFAALNYADGKVYSSTAERHTHVEWLSFLKLLHRQTPKDLSLHLVVDNYGTHKHPLVKTWIEKHPRIHLHFTPTGSSWLNLVERFFRQITDEVIRDGSFASVNELVEAINVHLYHHNLNPTPIRWHAKGQAILEKIQRARTAAAKA